MNQHTAGPEREPVKEAWWKEAVIYEIYPRSFKDSDGDGIGDLKGIISELDYLSSLGINLVWLTPVFASPNADNGYDISDYFQIMTEFGTMEDFDRLLNELHRRNIRLLIDVVLNHTSDQHAWFIASRQNKHNPYREYYHWWPAEKGKPPHRFSFFDNQAEAWAFDEQTNSYYLHYFAPSQPDLNWENPEVRRNMHNMMRFWLDKGVDGFRFDAATYIAKDTRFPEITAKEISQKYMDDWSYYYSKGPKLHEYLKEIRLKVLDNYNITTIAETPGIEKHEAIDFVDEQHGSLHMLYHFEGMTFGNMPYGFKKPNPNGYKLSEFKKIYSQWDAVFEERGWGTLYLGNHDHGRMLTRWGNDSDEHRSASAKLLLCFLMTMRSTPIIYNGDELGMRNIRFESIEDYKDMETISKYNYYKATGQDTEQLIKDQQINGRDNARTPFQWSNEPNAGFTTGTPWIKINDDYRYINRDRQEEDPQSVLHFFRRLTALRKENLTLVYGRYQLWDAENEQVYTYTRTRQEECLLVLLNFSATGVTYEVPPQLPLDEHRMLLNNMQTFKVLKKDTVFLQPYQAVILQLDKPPEMDGHQTG
ncbi:MAG: glycoside hydrolase family 13 protein [Agriterribacter sp.]